MTVSEARLEFRNVTKQFRNSSGTAPETITAVEGVSLSVKDGEVVSLIGPSGCGKSTLLNLASGLDQPTAGEVFVDATRVVGPSSHVAFMLQKDLLLPWRSIRENVELGLEIQGVSRSEQRERAMNWLRQCHLADFANHFPHQLSGGMRQRAALARTLVLEPSVLLLDEPFSALDAQTKMVLQQDLAVSIKVNGKTALLITHDLAEAAALSDRVLVMSKRPGHITEELVIDVPDRENPLVRRQQLSDHISHLMKSLDIDHLELGAAK
jgi:NitT/TauT family transport system ATP-binding protein